MIVWWCSLKWHAKEAASRDARIAEQHTRDCHDRRERMSSSMLIHKSSSHAFLPVSRAGNLNNLRQNDYKQYFDVIKGMAEMML